MHGPPGTRLLAWFATARRDLPWRQPPRDPWPVLLSETMLQQTQVDRVIPAYERWLARWPTPADLAAAPTGEAIREWGRLGYPRRALRLHAAATVIADAHDNRVPGDAAALRALPGVGSYTAAAVLAFAFRRRVAVLDTNVRRVYARVWDGEQWPSSASPGRAEQTRALDALPHDPEAAATTSEAVMELGALVCRATAPRCDQCPLRSDCSWFRAGHPALARPRSGQPKFEGSLRQARGLILAELRSAVCAVDAAEIARLPLGERCSPAVASLLADGLIMVDPDGRYRLPR